ncbi:hypothetical protein [Nitrosomonas halophila]|uniref:Transglutaminase-like superfamily protein n=1 Tax=Nitrosomonas halophila TaxID=44576 RepID=A0A1H3J2L0_9PROT|nr:hypothetical protein [Nitrosomonas halophila]SDY34047.1 hypothetical protein SAMN05421881_10302 [Nitrosomonas halophila]
MNKLRLVIVFLALFFSGAGLYVQFDWRSDNAALLAFAQSVIQDDNVITAQDIERLNALVYSTGGFAKNDRYFIFPALGPTPTQIMQEGGDCADKSRLLAAILDELNVPATLVMLSPCDTCAFGHTVVEAITKDGAIAVDPIYNISFPSPDGRYYGIQALRNDADILQTRLDELILQRGPEDKVAFYRLGPDGIHYSYPVTVNWAKNSLTQFVGLFLARYIDEPSLIYRPRWLEDPKLLISSILGVLSICSIGLVLMTVFLPHLITRIKG